MKKFRNPYISVLLVLLIFSSCTRDTITDDLLERKFDYSIHNEFKSNNYNGEIIGVVNTYMANFKDSVAPYNVFELLNEVNDYYRTDLNFPNEFLNTLSHNFEDIPDILIEMGFIGGETLSLIDSFLVNLNNSDFNVALEKFETSVLVMNLSDSEFKTKNDFVNVLKTLYHYNPHFFSSNNSFEKSSKSGFGCLRAALALTAASVALASCVTVVTCGIAVTGWILAYGAYQDNCMNHHQ
jgi:hypothetical protein